MALPKKTWRLTLARVLFFFAVFYIFSGATKVMQGKIPEGVAPQVGTWTAIIGAPLLLIIASAALRRSERKHTQTPTMERE